jgi:hypothetical protein
MLIKKGNQLSFKFWIGLILLRERFKVVVGNLFKGLNFESYVEINLDIIGIFSSFR